MEDKSQVKPLVIIGAGPAGLTASIYASRYKISHLIIAEAVGGLAFEAHKVCNFPTEAEISGMDLMTKMQKHSESLGAEIIIDKVVAIKKQGKIFKLVCQSGKTFFSQTILLALGTKHRRLNLPAEKLFLGKGVSYCATCDAMFYQNKVVAVIGGGNSAQTASLYLAKIAKQVYQIYRRDKLRGEIAWIDQVLADQKIKVIYNTEVKDLKGKDNLEALVLSKPYQNKGELKVDGLFIEIGAVPQKELTTILKVKTNEAGYIEVDTSQKTSQEQIWAAGDITLASNSFRQVVTACSEGAVAADSIFKFLQTNNQDNEKNS